jgi:hypothetical protein
MPRFHGHIVLGGYHGPLTAFAQYRGQFAFVIGAEVHDDNHGAIGVDTIETAQKF